VDADLICAHAFEESLHGGIAAGFSPEALQGLGRDTRAEDAQGGACDFRANRALIQGATVLQEGLQGFMDDLLIGLEAAGSSQGEISLFSTRYSEG
jgi:hypothetical protein